MTLCNIRYACPNSRVKPRYSPHARHVPCEILREVLWWYMSARSTPNMLPWFRYPFLAGCLVFTQIHMHSIFHNIRINIQSIVRNRWFLKNVNFRYKWDFLEVMSRYTYDLKRTLARNVFSTVKFVSRCASAVKLQHRNAQLQVCCWFRPCTAAQLDA